MQTIFVTGATGTIGKEVVTALEQTEDVTVTAASRSAPNPFDYADPDTYSLADGHDAIFLLAPPLDPSAHHLLLPFLDYLRRSDNPRITYLGAYGMEGLTSLPVHAEAEAALHRMEEQHGTQATILRPGFFATNFGIYERENIEQRNMIFNPAGSGATPFVHPGDVGRVAALTLTDPTHAGKTYTLTGPRAYTMYEVADLVSQQVGRSISYPEPSDHTYRTALAQAGAPPFVAEYMIDVYGLIRNGRVSEATQDVERLTGRPATDLSEVIRRDFGRD